MKADDYCRKFEEYVANGPPIIWEGAPPDLPPRSTADTLSDALIAICQDLILEAIEIVKQRNVKCGSAMIAVFREQNQKYRAIISRLKKKSGCEGFRVNGFIGFLEVQYPLLCPATILDKWRVKEEVLCQ